MRSLALAIAGLLVAGAGPAAGASDLASPPAKEIAMRLVSSAENSSLDWRAQYRYIEDIHDGRGYTAGIIGFCSGTGDMLQVVRAYTRARPHNRLARFLTALRRVNGTASHAGLGRKFVARLAARGAQPRVPPRPGPRARPRVLQPVRRDREVRRPPGAGPVRLLRRGGRPRLRRDARRAPAGARARRGPVAGGDETAYLEAFLDERVVEMRKEAAHEDVSRIETAQRRFLREGNLDLQPPLRWAVYGDEYSIAR